MDTLTLCGAVWDGSRTASSPGHVVVGSDGILVSVRPDDGTPGPQDGRVIAGAWVGPALVDAHVHLALGAPDVLLRSGVGAVRDLGAPLARAIPWRASDRPVVAVTGELLTALGGYPTNSWGADGFGWPVADPGAAAPAVRRLVEAGVDLVKLALEPALGQPVPDLATARAIVVAAHAAGLSVTCHALSVAMVERALDAGVDELCHTPTEPLPPALLDRLADRGVPVVSTLRTFVDQGVGDAARANAAALVRAGVPLVYGTDLGNVGTSPGPSVAELELLAAAGLGQVGALEAATVRAAALAGLVGRVDVVVEPGARTVLVVLAADPTDDPWAWESPVAVVAEGRIVGGSELDGPR